ncbi:hypothetical protein FocTR4_00008606 [Fusarium oxysporum f. sp. cubense]|uniref:Uncharacterized protein n=1 Tax=Fusarium oxysporum f. sp. cubense TaxID=61366 RepID=A0A5C6ST07_FUSOC|nr:hypothetical protein FocTR4_00008606 [Fusarium oxysporum f. sp. cubense]
MCRGENVQCKECCRLSSRIVELCIRGELMATCPETIIEGVSLEKESRRLSKHRRKDMSRGEGRLLPEASETMTRLRAEPEKSPGLLNQANMEGIRLCFVSEARAVCTD